MSQQCLKCFTISSDSDSSPVLVKRGFFVRKIDSVKIQRFHCRKCHKSFSTATNSLCYYQKRRDVNSRLFEYLAGGVSQRRAAIILKINRKTVVRKFLLTGTEALFQLRDTQYKLKKVSIMEFDDLETFEHSKCKPLSVTLAVEYRTQRILGFRVSVMPAKGLLAALSRKKYGKRIDERKKNRRELFKEIKPHLIEHAEIKSDENPHYPPDVKCFFGKANHKTYKSRRGCVVGQGELKAGGFDPLFSLNHTCAMFRDNINRLKRRTWATTKKKERLELHIAIYALYHNFILKSVY